MVFVWVVWFAFLRFCLGGFICYCVLGLAVGAAHVRLLFYAEFCGFRLGFGCLDW